MCEVCGGDCKLCEGNLDVSNTCYTENSKVDIAKVIVSRIQDIGRAENMIQSILSDEIFTTLSKHNPYYHSEYELEADKLDDLRRKLSCIQDILWDIMNILRKG